MSDVLKMPRQIVGSSSTSRATATGAPPSASRSTSKGCAHKRAVAQEQQMAVGVDGLAARAQHQLRRATAERAEEHRALVPAFLLLHAQVKEVPAVGEKLRPSMAGVRRAVGGGDRHRAAAAGRDLLHPANHGRREQDGALRIPAAAAPAGRVAQRERRPGIHVEALQLAVGEEPDRAAVGRPERERRLLGARQRFGRQRVQAPQPQLPAAARVDGRKHDGGRRPARSTGGPA